MQELEAFAATYKTLDEATEAGEAQADALPAARDALKAAMASLLLAIAAKSDDAELCKQVDEAMVTWRPEVSKYASKSSVPLLKPALLKGSLLAALKLCSSYPALMALPQLMETTRKLLCAAPANGVEKFLVDELGADIAKCTDAKQLQAAATVLKVHMQAEGRLKKDLQGFALAAPSQKSVRTAANKAAKALASASDSQGAEAAAAAKKAAAAAAKEKAAAFEALQKGA